MPNKPQSRLKPPPPSKEREVSYGHDSLKTYLQEISRVPLLTIKEENQLAARIHKGDQAAVDHMVRANLRLVVKIANDYSNFGLPLMDLISEGNIGLMKAVERFDPAKGGKLSTYASWWIKQGIKRALANQGKTIRLPVHLVERISKMRRTAMALRAELERDPTNEEIAEEMGLTVEKISHLQSIAVKPASLDRSIGDDENTNLGDLLPDEAAEAPSDELEYKGQLKSIHEIIGMLDPREAEIISLRFGLDGRRPMTLEEVGTKLGITRERVRQLQNSIFKQIREMLSESEDHLTADELEQKNLRERRLQVMEERASSNGA